MPTIKMRDAQGNWADVYSGGGNTLLDIIDAKIEAACPYKPGDYCISNNGTSPAERWPGTVWAQLPPGTFLAAAGEGYAVGSTGGKATVALTVGNLPNAAPKNLFVQPYGGASPAGGGARANLMISNDSYGPYTTAVKGTLGDGTAHENRPPYYATNIWRRTA